MGMCRYSNQNAGFLRQQHRQCRDLRSTGIQEMTQLAAQAAGTTGFNETAHRSTLQAIAQRSRATEQDIDRALEEGFRQGVGPSDERRHPHPPGGGTTQDLPAQTAGRMTPTMGVVEMGPDVHTP